MFNLILYLIKLCQIEYNKPNLAKSRTSQDSIIFYSFLIKLYLLLLRNLPINSIEIYLSLKITSFIDLWLFPIITKIPKIFWLTNNINIRFSLTHMPINSNNLDLSRFYTAFTVSRWFEYIIIHFYSLFCKSFCSWMKLQRTPYRQYPFLANAWHPLVL